jgi:hypothetical protein
LKNKLKSMGGLEGYQAASTKGVQRGGGRGTETGKWLGGVLIEMREGEDRNVMGKVRGKGKGKGKERGKEEEEEEEKDKVGLLLSFTCKAVNDAFQI